MTDPVPRIILDDPFAEIYLAVHITEAKAEMAFCTLQAGYLLAGWRGSTTFFRAVLRSA
jgi:hypothetical protein